MDRVQKAMVIAFKYHKGQIRKVGGAPYIVHVLEVAQILLSEPGISEDVVVAGILHDVLEDTSYTAEQLERDFGPYVLSLIQFVTEPGNGPTATREESIRTWRARKEHIIQASDRASRDQLLVLAADKLSNVTSLQEELHLYGEAIWACFNAPKEDILWYYRSLRSALATKLQDTRLIQLYDLLTVPFQ